jgi:hypothetical protein
MKVCLLIFILLPSKTVQYGEQVQIFPILSTMPRSFKVRHIPCPVKSCTRQFTNQGGLKNHVRIHRTPKKNPELPHQQPMNDDIDIDDYDILDDNDVPVDPEHQNHPQNPEKATKEKVTHHPLINGKPLHFYYLKKLMVI